MTKNDVIITHDEAVSLYYHLDIAILDEIRDVGEEYDNMNYLLNLVHIYDRCKKEVYNDKC